MLEDVKPRSTIQNSVTEKSLHNHMLEDPLMNHMLEDPLMNKQHVRGSPHEHVRGSPHEHLEKLDPLHAQSNKGC